MLITCVWDTLLGPMGCFGSLAYRPMSSSFAISRDDTPMSSTMSPFDIENRELKKPGPLDPVACQLYGDTGQRRLSLDTDP